MLELKDIEINEMKFQLNPLRGFKALKLDKKVISMLLPILEGVESLDSSIDFGKALSGLSGALDNLPDAEYEKFVVDLLSTTIFISPEGAVQISSEVIDKYFGGAAMTIYQLMFEVMKYNNFTPFALVSKGGKGTISTLISEKLTSAT